MTDLPQDIALRVKKLSAAVLPPGSYATAHDRLLGWVGPGPYDTAWQSIADLVGTAITGGIAISALPAASTLDGSEAVPIVQSGATVRTTTQDIADLGGGGGLSNQGFQGLVEGSLVTITLDGTTQTVPWSIASGSGGTWLVAGSIVEAGVYVIGVLFGDAGGVTVPGTYVSVTTSAFSAGALGQGVYAVDAFATTFADGSASHSVICEETMSFALADLPVSLNNTTTFYTQDSVGGALTAIPYVWRVAA